MTTLLKTIKNYLTKDYKVPAEKVEVMEGIFKVNGEKLNKPKVAVVSSIGAAFITILTLLAKWLLD